MNRRSAIGRGDLVRALANKPASAHARIAVVCGCIVEEAGRPYPPPALPKDRDAERPTRIPSLDHRQSESQPPDKSGHRYLVPVFADSREPEKQPPDSGGGWEVFKDPLDDHEIEARDVPVPAAPPLQPWSRLWPWLRNALGRRIEGRRIDTRQLIRTAAKAQPIRRLPRLKRLSWAARACVIVDRRNALAPFWDDFDSTIEMLARMRGKEGLIVRTVQEAMPEPGVPVLLMGDLGRCSQDATLREYWLAFGRDLLRQGNTLSALLPCPRDRWEAELAGLWLSGCWNGGERLPRQGQRAVVAPDDALTTERAARVEAVLTLLSPALRVEPGLLRLLAALGGGGAGVEFDVWNSQEVARTPLAIALFPEVALRRRVGFSQLDEQTKDSVRQWIEAFHAGCSPTLRAREILNLAESGVPGIAERADEARKTLRRANARLFHIARNGDTKAAECTGLFEWQAREVARVAEDRRAVDQEISVGWALRRHWNRDRKTMDRVPKGINPADVAWVQNLLEADPSDETVWELRQQGRRLVLRRKGVGKSGPDAGFAPGPPLAWVRARRPRLDLTLEDPAEHTAQFQILKPSPGGLIISQEMPRSLRLETDCGGLQVFTAPRPGWASQFGRDGVGLYAELQVKGVTLRLRWIPPGRFRMGSPKEEKGRRDNEGPAHEVTISVGYWLAETPCTQAQWEAVMGENPSRFKGIARPVERVTWRQCVEFCERMREQAPSMNFRLPTEAEWEYACRAGTDSAFNDGSDCTEPQGNDPALDRLGWFSQNSKSETHPVREKAPNGWGLYDMHGSGWEWCLDGRRDYSETPQTDPVGPTDESARRALRGGSIWDSAWYCRAACRDVDVPGNRFNFVGFRLASGQPPGSGATQSRSDGGAETGSEGRGPGPRFSGIGLDFGELSRFAIIRPKWARQFGRDRFGHFSAFEVKDVAFRLRWIEAGSFLMGSPAGEAGRSDDEGPQHRVTISRGFWLGETPCTQEQWKAVTGANPSYYKGPKNPVDSVTWHECIEFCARLNERSPELELRLPSEAEWEYACRAGTETAFNDGSDCTQPTGDDPALNRLGWYDRNSGNKTHPVGEKNPNPSGLHDLHGNVWEWCLDAQRKYRETPATDPLEPTNKSARRALRGGSFWYDAGDCRAACRVEDVPGYRNGDVGFRLASGQPPGSGATKSRSEGRA